MQPKSTGHPTTRQRISYFVKMRCPRRVGRGHSHPDVQAGNSVGRRSRSRASPRICGSGHPHNTLRVSIRPLSLPISLSLCVPMVETSLQYVMNRIVWVIRSSEVAQTFYYSVLALQ